MKDAKLTLRAAVGGPGNRFRISAHANGGYTRMIWSDAIGWRLTNKPEEEFPLAVERELCARLGLTAKR